MIDALRYGLADIPSVEEHRPHSDHDSAADDCGCGRPEAETLSAAHCYLPPSCCLSGQVDGGGETLVNIGVKQHG